MNAAVNLSPDSHDLQPESSPSTTQPSSAGGLSRFAAWLGPAGIVLALGAGIGAGVVSRDGSLAILASLLGALLCVFAGWRLTNFSTRRLSWFIVAGALFVRGIGELLGKGGALSVTPAIFLFLQALLLWLGLLFLARAASAPHALHPGETPENAASEPFDWALAPDAIVIGGAASALAWWLLIEPALLSASIAKATSGPLGFYHIVAFVNLAAAVLLIVGRREMHPVVTQTDEDGYLHGAKANSWHGAWSAAFLGALFCALATYRVVWLHGNAPQLIDIVLRVAAPLLIGFAALSESAILAPQWPGHLLAPLDPGAARAFWLRNLTPLLFAGLAVAAAQWHFNQVGHHDPKMPVPGTRGENWWGLILVAVALARHALDSLLTTRQTFEDYRTWNDMASTLQADVDARTRELSTLHAVASDLSNTLDSAKILSTALDRMMNALHSDAGALWLYKGDAVVETPLALTGTAGQDGFSESEARQVERRKSQKEGRTLSETSPAGIGSAASIRKALVEAAIAQATSAHRPEWMPKGERWHLVRAAGDDPLGMRGETQRNSLKAIHNGLELGDVPNGLLTCRSLNNTFQGSHIIAIQWKGEILGAMAVLRGKGALTPAETTLMQSLAIEVGTALQNAHLYQEAVRLADRDSLTDLLNHRAVQQQLNVCLSRAARSRDQFVILMMDLNNFKFFNDTYGHQIGDEVLKRAAECLRQSCRISDVIGRYGGDEFIAVLMDTDSEGTKVVVNRIEQKLLEQALESGDGRRIPIGMSFGASIFPHDGDKALDLLSVASSNVTEAKMSGGGFIVRRHEEESEELKALKDASIGGSFGVLDALVTAIDNKDNYTRRHSEDVARWAVMIARQLDFTPEDLRSIRICGLLHDVGKIAVPDSVLRKPGRLNDDEFKVMQQHPVFGALIVKEVPNLDQVLGGIRHHHERYDGKGYPDRIAGEDIPLFGRILAVPDCYSAMTTNRPYRQGLTMDEAISEIIKGKGTQFDPVIADAFLKGIREMQAEEAEKSRKEGTPESVIKGPEEAADKTATPTPTALSPSEMRTKVEEGKDSVFGDTGYYMNIKPRSVTDAELESAEQNK